MPFRRFAPPSVIVGLFITNDERLPVKRVGGISFSDRLFLYQEWVPQVSILRPGRLQRFKCKFTRSEIWFIVPLGRVPI